MAVGLVRAEGGDVREQVVAGFAAGAAAVQFADDQPDRVGNATGAFPARRRVYC